MATYVVQCVNIDSGSSYDDCRCIESIGFTSGGVVKPYSPAQVYDWVENDGHTVVVKHNGKRTNVHGAKHGSTKYVKTEPNNTKNDNLLKQDPC